jgi:hypothetical protein
LAIPAYWHKNYGVTAAAIEASARNPEEQARFRRVKLEQWRLYADSGAEDAQMDQIRSILRQAGF